MKASAAMAAAAVLFAACASEPVGSAPADTGRLAWYQVETRESQQQDDVLAEITLRVGYINGTTTAVLPLPFNLRQDLPPIGIGFITGPADGHVYYALDDGTRSSVSAVEVASGEIGVVHETDQPILAGAVHPSGDRLYLLLTDRQADPMRAPAHLLELPLADGEVAGEPVERPWLDDAPVDRLEIFSVFHFTPDGSRLIVQRCRDNACSYRMVSLADGTGILLEPGGTGEIVGVTDEALLVHPSSWTGPMKTFQLLPLPGSELEGAAFNAPLATLVTTEAGTRVVLDKGQPGFPEYVVVDPRTGEGRPLDVALEHMGALVAEPGRQGLRPPPGYAVFASEGRIGYSPLPTVLVHVLTGRTVQLQNLE